MVRFTEETRNGTLHNPHRIWRDIGFSAHSFNRFRHIKFLKFFHITQFLTLSLLYFLKEVPIFIKYPRKSQCRNSFLITRKLQLCFSRNINSLIAWFFLFDEFSSLSLWVKVYSNGLHVFLFLLFWLQVFVSSPSNAKVEVFSSLRI